VKRIKRGHQKAEPPAGFQVVDDETIATTPPTIRESTPASLPALPVGNYVTKETEDQIGKQCALAFRNSVVAHIGRDDGAWFVAARLPSRRGLMTWFYGRTLTEAVAKMNAASMEDR
jgi:hypothetical protein